MSQARPTVAYVGGPLPDLSQTFVLRELLGLRSRGWDIVPLSVNPPMEMKGDPSFAGLDAESIDLLDADAHRLLPGTFLAMPGQMLRAVKDAATADLLDMKARAKFLRQAWLGLANARRLKGRGIGHVHAHLANIASTVALYLARGLGVPFSFTGHAADLFAHRAALAFKLKEAAFAACITHWHRDFYAGIVPADEARRPLVRCSVRMPAEVKPEGRDIVAVGRLVEKKGLDVLIRAFAKLPAGDMRLKIAGDGPERAKLEALATGEGVADRVDFLGARAHEDCLALIAGCAIFALPCRIASSGDRDGIPVVLMEAMAAGRAVVAGYLPTIAELVEDGVNGLTVPPEHVDALAEALRVLIDDPDRRSALGAAGRRRVAEEFSDDVNWARMEAAIGRAAGRG